MSNWHHVTTRFDRIIVDEAQDFSPAWLGLLESLLDPDGANQIFLLADPHQQLIDRGFTMPTAAAGWVTAELPFNVRNAKEIARVARRHLDGSAAASRLAPKLNTSTAKLFPTLYPVANRNRCHKITLFYKVFSGKYLNYLTVYV